MCIYTFVPSKNRESFDLEEMSDQVVRRFADIQSIEATWPSAEAQQTAVRRLEMMKNRRSTDMQTASFSFVVNDMITYHSPSDFHSSTARTMFMDMLQAKERRENDARQLEALRVRFYHANEQERKDLKATILDAEKELELLSISISKMEKQPLPLQGCLKDG